MNNNFQNSPVMLFGAGKLGRQILALLRNSGVEPVAFLDNRQAGGTLDGLPIWTPAQGAQRHGEDGLCVTTSYRPVLAGGMSDMRAQMSALGCRNVVPFPQVLWNCNGPAHFLWDHPAKLDAERDAIDAASRLFHDAESRDAFARHLEFRRTADESVLPPLAQHPQYFPEFLAPHPQECFVDCGAFDGDTLAPLHTWNPHFARVIAFEADPANFVGLQHTAEKYAGRIDCRQQAVAATEGMLRFSSGGSTGSALSDSGDIEVPAVALDNALEGETPTFIKMDIEGAEVDALQGARETIARTQPVLAICVYHRQSDLWRIPLWIRKVLPEAALFLRSYALDGFETVCYAIPNHRLR